jgi:formate hydrogenlyase transcriptional activator
LGCFVPQVPDRHLNHNGYASGSDEFPRHYQALLQTADPDATARSMRGLFAELLKQFEKNIRFDHLDFSLHDPARNVLVTHPLLQKGTFEIPDEVPVAGSLELVLRQHHTIEVRDVETESGFADVRAIAQKGGFQSFRVIPLTTERRTLGTLGVGRVSPGSFSEEDIRFVHHVAELVALVLENALMADVLSRERTRLETLLNVSNALVSSLNVHKLFQQVSASIRRVVQQGFTHLALYDENANAMRSYALDVTDNRDFIAPETLVPVSETPAGIAFVLGERKVFTNADLQSIDSEFTRNLLARGIHTLCCFPLVSRGRKLGTLGLSSLNENAFAPHDIDLLAQIASQVAIGVDNARAYDEIAKLKDRLAKEKLYLEEELHSEHNFGEIVGNSAALRQVLKRVEIAAPSDATVLVLGETGTGKELIARAVHRLSTRSDGNFIKLNCAAIPTGLLESELFGHEKGAFTGAVSQKIGRLELADKGTIFLDEIGEIPTELQPKLLRVLQDHEFERLGGIRTIRVNVRLVAATNRNLAQAVTDHQFRSDLFYRLNVFPIHAPPLRERAGDIPLLVRYFVQKFSRRMNKDIDSIPSEIIRELEHWHWPGNIRELENFIERSVILTQGPVFFAPMAELHVVSADRTRAGTTLQDVEREYILLTLRESGGVIAGAHGAAARLGMKRTTLQSRMQKLGITREEYET